MNNIQKYLEKYSQYRYGYISEHVYFMNNFQGNCMIVSWFPYKDVEALEVFDKFSEFEEFCKNIVD